MAIESRTSSADWQQRLSIVIPAYNEEAGIKRTLADLSATMPDAEIIVVNDASTDNTAAEVKAFANVTLVSHLFNRGYGGALKTGMQVAKREFVAWFDADNEHRVEDLTAMAQQIASKPLAAVIGARTKSGISPARTWGKAVIRWIARRLDVRVGSDINCGLRVFRRDVVTHYLALLPNGFSASITSLMILLERRYPISFYPISLNERIGESKVKLADGFEAIRLVIAMIMLFAPLRIFLRIGVFLIIVGAIYGVSFAIVVQQGLPVFAALVMMTGALVSMFGLLATQISQWQLSSLEHSIYTIAHDAQSGTKPEPTARE